MSSSLFAPSRDVADAAADLLTADRWSKSALVAAVAARTSHERDLVAGIINRMLLDGELFETARPGDAVEVRLV